MANEIKYTSVSLTPVADDGGVLPTIKNLADGSRKLCGEVDNTATLDQYAKVVVKVKGSSSFAASGEVDLYLIESSDGTNYERGDDSTAPTKLPAWTWRLASTTASQELVAHIRIPPSKYKLLIANRGGVAFSNTNGENTVSVGHYNDEIQ